MVLRMMSFHMVCLGAGEVGLERVEFTCGAVKRSGPLSFPECAPKVKESPMDRRELCTFVPKGMAMVLNC